MEKGADPGAIYICSTCTGRIGSMNRGDVRELVDKLYLAGRTEDAQFVEKLVFGANNASAEVPSLIKRTVALKIRKRSI
jgi:hypothetical protein